MKRHPWPFMVQKAPHTGEPEVKAPSMTITENGVAKVKAADVFKTEEAREQLAAVARLRTVGVKGTDGGQKHE